MSASKELFMQLRDSEVAVQAGISFEHLLDAKKSNLQSAVNAITNAVQDGQLDELKGLILAKKGTEFFSQLEKSLRPLAEDKYVYNIGKDYVAHDTRVEASEIGVKYDFYKCGDPIWDELNVKSERIGADKKERETFLKAITKPTTIVDDNTGEVATIYPPVKSGKLGLKLTIK